MTPRRIEVSAALHSTTAWGVLEEVAAIAQDAGITDLMTVEVTGERFNNQGTLVNVTSDRFQVLIVGFGASLEPARVRPQWVLEAEQRHRRDREGRTDGRSE